jgi:hypothetical protein
MFGLLTSIFKTLFPDRARFLISSLTFVLCASAVWVLEHFRIASLLPAALLPWILDLLAVALLVILGLLALLIVSSHRQRVPSTKEVKSRKNLSANALQILAIFGKQGDERLTTQQLSQELDLSFNQAQLAIDELLKFDLLYPETSWTDEKFYYLSTTGRAFLGKEKLL